MVGPEVHILVEAFQPVHLDALHIQSDSLGNEETLTFLVKWITEGHIVRG